MLTGQSLSDETRAGLSLLIGWSVSARLREGRGRDDIRSDVLRYVVQAVRRVEMDEWEEETLVAFAQRAIESCLASPARVPDLSHPTLRRAS